MYKCSLGRYRHRYRVTCWNLQSVGGHTCEAHPLSRPATFSHLLTTNPLTSLISLSPPLSLSLSLTHTQTHTGMTTVFILKEEQNCTLCPVSVIKIKHLVPAVQHRQVRKLHFCHHVWSIMSSLHRARLKGCHLGLELTVIFVLELISHNYRLHFYQLFWTLISMCKLTSSNLTGTPVLYLQVNGL